MNQGFPIFWLPITTLVEEISNTIGIGQRKTHVLSKKSEFKTCVPIGRRKEIQNFCKAIFCIKIKGIKPRPQSNF